MSSASRPIPGHRLSSRRINLLLIVFVLLFGLIVARVFTIQVVRSEEFGAQAVAERFQEHDVPARRGDILDANGMRLATNVPADRVTAIISLIDDKHDVAVKLRLDDGA